MNGAINCPLQFLQASLAPTAQEASARYQLLLARGFQADVDGRIIDRSIAGSREEPEVRSSTVLPARRVRLQSGPVTSGSDLSVQTMPAAPLSRVRSVSE